MKLKFPTAYSILLGLIVLVAILSWLVPVGRFERQMNAATQREVPVAGSFHFTASKPQSFSNIVLAPISGFYDADSYKANAIDIVLFVLVIGGFIGVVNHTGMFNVLISKLIITLRGREIWLIPAFMLFFCLAGSTGSMYEESLSLFGIIIPIFLLAGYDRLTAVAVIFMGLNIGMVGSTANPFSSIIASNVAGTVFTEGLTGRIIVLVIGYLLTTAYLMRYAIRVKNNPAHSLVAEGAVEHNQHFLANTSGTDTIPAMGFRQWLIFAVFLASYVTMFVGVLFKSWWMPQMTAVFLVAAIVIGLIARMAEETIVKHFIAGAADLLGVALIIGVARGVVVIMDASQISDTILYWSSQALAHCPKVLFINLMYWLEFGLSFLVPSSSGLAVLSMPILAPLSDLVQVDRSLVISAYQYGSGMMNIVTPTNAVLIGSLMIGRISLGTWLRFIWPIMALMTGLITLALSAGVLLG